MKIKERIRSLIVVLRPGMQRLLAEQARLAEQAKQAKQSAVIRKLHPRWIPSKVSEMVSSLAVSGGGNANGSGRSLRDVPRENYRDPTLRDYGYFAAITQSAKRKRGSVHQHAAKRACLDSSTSNDCDDEEIMPSNFGTTKKEEPTGNASTETKPGSPAVSTCRETQPFTYRSERTNISESSTTAYTPPTSHDEETFGHTSDIEGNAPGAGRDEALADRFTAGADQRSRDRQALRDRLRLNQLQREQNRLEMEDIELNRQLREIGD